MLQIPLFPLHTVLFPGMPLMLHIFEPRYRVMTRGCIERNAPFGVVLIRQGEEAGGPPASPCAYGCTARIIEVENLPDGCMNITVIGEDRFRILELDTSLDYLQGTVETHHMENPRPLEVLRGLRSLHEDVHTYLRLVAQANSEELNLTDLDLPDDTLGLLYMAASLLQLPTSEKQPLLEAESSSHMLQQLQRLYRREIAILSPSLLIPEERARKASWLN